MNVQSDSTDKEPEESELRTAITFVKPWVAKYPASFELYRKLNCKTCTTQPSKSDTSITLHLTSYTDVFFAL